MSKRWDTTVKKCLFIAMLFVGVSAVAATSMESSAILRAKDGRQVVLVGFNTSDNSKPSNLNDTGLSPTTFEPQVELFVNSYGNNAARVMIDWEHVMPSKGVIDYAYLDEFAKQVDWHTSRGAQVVIDMHQGLYSQHMFVGGGQGNGAPAWAIEPGQETINAPPRVNGQGDASWMLYHFDERMEVNFKNLYTNKYGLSDYYADAWVAIANKFKDNPNVIAYDLMNEPWISNECMVFVSQCTAKYVVPFYQKLINRIRTVDQETWIAFEPVAFPVDAIGAYGLSLGLSALHDALPDGDQKLLFMPHFYALDAQITDTFFPLIAHIELALWKLSIFETASRMKVPVVMGETGFSSSMHRPLDWVGLSGFLDWLGMPSGVDQYQNMMFAMYEKTGMGRLWWSDDPAPNWQHWGPFDSNWNITPAGRSYQRAYPKYIAGTLLQYSNNQCQFRMSYDPHLQSASLLDDGWTEIFLPEYCYGSVMPKISVTTKSGRLDNPAATTTVYDADKHTLKLRVSDTTRNHYVNIEPG